MARVFGAENRASGRPIGVFDSGLGGLTVVRELRRLLPAESIVYFGDTARQPYGIKSREQIQAFSIRNTLFLMKHKVKAVVVACNSSSSAAYPFLKRSFSIPIIDVIEPAARSAVHATRTGRIGVIATQSTVASGAYGRALKKINPDVTVFQEACPLLVPLVEEGRLRGEITEKIVDGYLAPLRRNRFDTLILGCTHYPLLSGVIRKKLGPRINLIDSAAPTVESLFRVLNQKKLICGGRAPGSLKIFVSDRPRNFVRVGEDFLGEKLRHFKVVRDKLP